ncbi:prepilin-type N-terminal cleavage/methylation domain-containing protein [Sorangium sp. So ce1151]|uniref:prepilin-type N-terminal cleavage/methylation domain-containing protein n=1 Tax=Sorangium sp. So ce1151 TaxID=3133332 RepID=UPI003F5E1F2F
MVREFRPGFDRASRGRGRRGFTLVEVMLAAGIVAVLAALATQGVSKYFVLAKSAEAKHTIGAISRAVVVSADRLQARADGPAAQPLCSDAVTVPNAFYRVQGHKYQPDPSPGVDYNTGSPTVGWKCLGFEITHAQSYQYRYRLGGSPMPVSGNHFPEDVPLERRWAAYARGDLDGDGTHAWFALDGYMRDGQVVFASAIGTIDPDE